MPLDAVSLPDLGHEVYEDLPDFIQEALADPATQDVCFDPGGTVRVHAFSRFRVVGHLGVNDKLKFLRRIAELNRRYFGKEHPILRATSPRRERIEAVFPTVSPDGIAFVLRVPGKIMTLQDWVDRGSMTCEQKEFMESIAGEKNFAVAGGAGSGKTTMLRAVMECPAIKGTDDLEGKRWVSIESDLEVQVPENGIRLIDIEPQPGMPEIPFMRLLRSALRLMPEMIVVSEILNGEHAYAFVHAARGHIGCTTIHAKRPVLAPRAVQELGKMVGGIPTADVSEACEIVVQVEKAPGGGRRVREIATIGVEGNEFVAKRVA